jgi:cell shape-determining protein MreC
VIGSLQNGNLFTLKDRQVFEINSLFGKDANSILIKMETSERMEEVKELLDKYFILIQNGEGRKENAKRIRQELDIKLSKDDTELQKADVLLQFFDE